MNSREEIIDAMDGHCHDLPPPAIFTQTGTVEQMNACGRFWPEANFNSESMTELALQPSVLMGFATARIPYSITVEARALGCGIVNGSTDMQPIVTSSPYRTGGDIAPVPELISVSEFISDDWIQSIIASCKELSKHEDLFLSAAMIGPMGLVGYLAGFEEVALALFMEPDTISEWTSMLTPYQEQYASLLSENCDNVVIIEGGDTNLLPPDFFHLISDHLPKVISKAKSESYCTVHTCGDTFPVAKQLSSLGEDCLSAEASSDRERYVDLACKNCKLIGAINPVRTLLEGTPKDVVQSAKESVKAGFDLIGPECGVPPQTCNENLLALSQYRDR